MKEKGKIKIVAVDDEEEALRNIKILLEHHTDCELLDTCSTGETAIKSINLHRPHIVLLDIQMPEISGFDVIKSIRSIYDPIYIFITAYDQYAINAFEVNALDYLLKPFNDSRFFKALEKARRKLMDNVSVHNKLDALLQRIEAKESFKYASRLPVKTSKHLYFIEVKDIVHLIAEDHYVTITLINTTEHLIRHSLSKLEELLNPLHFFRINRSSIIKLDLIERIEPHFNGNMMITMGNKEKLRLSKNRKALLKRIINW